MTQFLGWLRTFGAFLAELSKSALSAIRSWSMTRWAMALGAIIAIVVAALLVDVPDIADLRSWAEGLGPWFVVAFVLGYVIFTQFPLPRTIWTVAAGVLFGAWVGLGLSLLALTLSAMISLLLVRWLLGDWIRPHLSHPAVFKINSRLERRGWLAIASLRMVAGVPFSILNYVAALTPIPVGQFTLATLIGSIPTTALGVFFGDALTGKSEPWLFVAMAILAVLGIGGLVLDSKLPQRP
ncbi:MULTISPECIES: TVP38/TMEM64 family protein [Corynebacterium]|uniref:TVP38/TMEM64 family protein n=1 Tax=Corynebacterium TaxID=1716 RepID=UPI0006690F2E|nr:MULTISPECIES: TVP38/TMEM64 family protein [Corynebacterium]MBD0855861.1 TVP38/TMEM64 family protein [Corynebacterium striatum]OFT66597.1 hypothetical protein HMPREF3148_01275 [Corynebacterium sp. HMSC05D08]PIS60173.1 hypothetical protein AZH44_05750 [Corynebacterium striatum]PIS60704.1 hypothetical protein AZH47_03000 [Corynebacterium striatum]PIS63874.1 hypothetical protein AZH45_05315 [Corynebacterium striatum]